jgi:hypothetical protein
VSFADGAVQAGIGVAADADFDDIQKQIRDFLKPLVAAYKVPRRFYRL